MNNDATNTTTACANCGKGEESSGDLKACVACKLVKYCNRDCQIAHRPLHKKACKKRAAELHDEALFKDPPPPEDCPVCFLPLPLDARQRTFNSCCGKLICTGCIYVMAKEARGRGKIGLCAFCRAQNATTVSDETKRIKKLIEVDNVHAFYNLAGYYESGIMGMPQDFAKANELFLRAGELGHAMAYFNLGIAYDNGRGVEVDKKKAKHFYELAAINGNLEARYNLGLMEIEAHNYHRAKKHFILAANAGNKESLEAVKKAFMGAFMAGVVTNDTRYGGITKDEYANTLRAYQKAHDETKSDNREKAEAASVWRNYENL